MTLKTFDINYGFNGEPSTVSITVASKIGSCNSSGSTVEGSLNGTLSTPNSQINALIKDYIISSKEEVIQAGFKEIKYQLVDKQAKRLSSIAVLVRGITASQKGDPFRSSSLIYDSAEVNAKGGYSSSGIQILNNGRVAIIGNTFATISATVNGNTASRVYNRGSVVFSTPSVITDTALINKLKEEETIAGASPRYGYYISELQSLITQCGYTVSNFPTGDKNLILDFGGSLKDCISSLASMFGLFYICRGNKITFYKTSELKASSIPNFNNDSDPTILSCSFSEDVLGKQTVGVIRGSVTPNNSSSSNTSITYNSGGARSKTINFYKIDQAKAYNDENLVATMFSMFRLGGSKDLFDRIIMYYKLKGSSINSNSFFSSYNLESKGKKKTSDLSESEKKEVEKKMPYLTEKATLYELPTNFKLPSQTALYGILDALCKSTGGLYVSQGVSSATARDFTVTASEGFVISQAYAGNTRLADIAELQGVVGLYAACGSNVENSTLSSFVKATSDTGGTALSNNYYIGVYDLMHKAQNTTDAVNAIKEASPDMRGTVLSLTDKVFFAVSSAEEKAYEQVISTSKSLYKSLASSVKEQVRGKATEIEETIDTGGGDTNEEDEIEYPASYVSFVVRAPSDNVISDISIAKFEGTVDEASYLSSNFSSLTQDQFNSKRSSVTYSGLKIPTESPFLVNVSVQFSAGSVQTSIEYSNVEFVAESNEVIMSQYAAASKVNILRSLTAKQKNSLGLN